MDRSKVIGAVFTLALLGGLLLSPSGCSNDDSLTSSPDIGLPGSGYDGYPPATPTGLGVVKATDTGFKLQWSANAETDLDGYRVYVYDPSPYRSNSYVCTHGNCLVATDRTYYLYSDDVSLGMHYFRIAAVDQDGNESVPTAPLEFCYTSDPQEDAILDGVEGDSVSLPRSTSGSGFDPKEDNEMEGDDTQ